MTATKYNPTHFAGVKLGATPAVVFAPGAGDPTPLGEVLTGIIACNASASTRELTLYYTHDAVSIDIFKQLALPAHSTTNLDLYLPLAAGMNVSAFGSNADDISLTLYGLTLVEV